MTGLGLLTNAAGLADLAISRITSKDLGSLAPGYAASRSGLRVYALLIVAIGLVLIGVGLAFQATAAGLWVMAVGLVTFLVSSVLILRGEVATYRTLPPNK